MQRVVSALVRSLPEKSRVPNCIQFEQSDFNDEQSLCEKKERTRIENHREENLACEIVISGSALRGKSRVKIHR